MRFALALVLSLASSTWAGAPDAGARPGALTPDGIKDVVHEHRAEVRRCYASAGTKKAGKVVVRFVIGLDGKVASAAISSTSLDEAAVEQCLTKVVQGFGFPKPKHGTVEVNFPFHFGPPRAQAEADPAPDEVEPDVLR